MFNDPVCAFRFLLHRGDGTGEERTRIFAECDGFPFAVFAFECAPVEFGGGGHARSHCPVWIGRGEFEMTENLTLPAVCELFRFGVESECNGFLRMRGEVVSEHRYACGERVVAGGRVQRHRRMRIIVVLLLVALERAEHRAALHVVAEDERVLLREQPRVAAVHEHRTVAVLLPRVQVLEVILVVRAVYHGIVDDGVLGAQPRAYVRVDRLEHGKIDLRCARCFRRRRFARRVCRGSGGCRRIVPRRLRLHLHHLLLERRIALVTL